MKNFAISAKDEIADRGQEVLEKLRANDRETKADLFEKMLRDAARDADVQLRQIEARQQGPDHPILWNVPETDYLKFYIFQVV